MTLEIWFSELGQMTVEQLSAVYRAAVGSRSSFPSIAEVRDLAGLKEPTDEDRGRETAERIFAGIGKFGSMVNQKSWPSIAAFIGPIGEEVVRLQGGWNQICDITDYDNATTLKAQWRELATALCRKARSGDLISPPKFSELPPRAQTALKGLLGPGGKFS